MRAGRSQLEPLMLVDRLAREVHVRGPGKLGRGRARIRSDDEHRKGRELLHRAVPRDHSQRLGEGGGVESDPVGQHGVGERLAVEASAHQRLPYLSRPFGRGHARSVQRPAYGVQGPQVANTRPSAAMGSGHPERGPASAIRSPQSAVRLVRCTLEKALGSFRELVTLITTLYLKYVTVWDCGGTILAALGST